MIRAWLDGQSSEVPGWVFIMEAAQEWHTPPWVIEEEVNQLWWERWLMMRRIKHERSKPKG